MCKKYTRQGALRHIIRQCSLSQHSCGLERLFAFTSLSLQEKYKNQLTNLRSNLRWELFTEDKIVERGIWLIGDLLVWICQYNGWERENRQEGGEDHLDCWSSYKLGLTELPVPVSAIYKYWSINKHEGFTDTDNRSTLYVYDLR